MIHWLSVTLKNISVEEVEIIVADVFPALSETLQEVSSSRWFEKVYCTPGREIIFYKNHRTVDNLNMLVISGDGCDMLSFEKYHKLKSYFEIYDYKVVRLDVAIDTEDITVDDFKHDVENGLTATRSHTTTYYEKKRENVVEKTFYVGSRQSGRMLRVYDKRGKTRIELELKEAWSRYAFDLVLSDWTDGVVALLENFMHNISEKVKSVLDKIKQIGVKVEMKVIKSRATLKKKLDWIVKQVAPTLALINLYDNEIIKSIINSGRARLSEVEITYYLTNSVSCCKV